MTACGYHFIEEGGCPACIAATHADRLEKAQRKAIDDAKKDAERSALRAERKEEGRRIREAQVARDNDSSAGFYLFLVMVALVLSVFAAVFATFLCPLFFLAGVAILAVEHWVPERLPPQLEPGYKLRVFLQVMMNWSAYALVADFAVFVFLPHYSGVWMYPGGLLLLAGLWRARKATKRAWSYTPKTT